MAASLKPYPAYKDSGVDWLGQVPERWDVHRLKTCARNVVEQTDNRRAGELYVALENVEGWTGRLSLADAEIPFDSQVKRFRSGDVLFGKLRPYLAKVTMAPDDGVCVGEFLVLRPRGKTPDARYLEVLLRSKSIIDAVSGSTFGAKMPRAEWSFVGGLRISVPPHSEQDAIVRYLDYMNRRIGRYIRAKQKLIKLLEEQKQAIIHQAVTGQIDVRTGKPYPVYKDSGVEWLGKVPERWDVRRVKHHTRILRGKFTHRPRNDPSLYGGQYPFVQTGDVARATKTIKAYAQTLNDRGLAVSKRFPRGTLVMTIAANIGDVAILDFEACFPDSIVGFVPGPGTARDYLYYAFKAMKAELLAEAPINTQGNLNIDRVGSRSIAKPPLREQQDIVVHIERSTSTLRRAIDQAHRESNLASEYRTRLIADVVTGKLDVREAAARLPDESDQAELLDHLEALAEDEQADGEGDLDAVPEEVEA